MNQQLVSRPPRGQQVMQNIRIALRIRRIWLISIICIFLLVLTLGILFVLGRFFGFFLPIVFLFLGVRGIWIIAAVPLFLLLLLLIFLLLTAKQHAINAYCKAVRSSLEKRMKSYYPPRGIPQLGEEQGQHLLLLGLPGSGKTKTLEHFLDEATSSALRENDRIPVLIQMKYYNGFLRQYRPDTSPDAQAAAATETLLAYLLDDKHEQNSQTTDESGLLSTQHLRPYLRQFVEQGRIVFLCDGMNELESDALQTVHDELICIMQTQNRVIMTCRELEYQEQTTIQDFARQGAIPKILPALVEDDVPRIVECYLQSESISDEQIQRMKDRICRINQPHRYTSPFMLTMLIQALSKLDERQAQTISRGRLLQISVKQRFAQEDAHAVQSFLSIIACTARRNGQRNAIQLGSNRKPIQSMEFAEYLNEWLQENEADDSDYTPSDIKKFLDIARRVGLISISNYGVLSFMHELIAEYFAAEYLFYIYRKNRNSESFWASLYASEAKAAGIWSEPVALWAGLEERPMEVATFLMSLVESYNCQGNELYYHALALSLACMGVKAPDALPQSIQKYLEKFVRVTAERVKLAKIFKRCADEGGAEVYEALLPLMDTEGLPDLFLELHELHCKSDDRIIPTLLFDYLEKVVTPTVYADKPLIDILGELGKRKPDASVRASAQSILRETAKPIPLRVAAIKILELIQNVSDVQLLISCLHDSDSEQRIAGAAISALATFGSELALDAMREKERNLRSAGDAQTRLNLLYVLKRFLETEQPQSNISSQYYKSIIDSIIPFLSLHDNNTTWQKARELLDEQMQKGTQRTHIVARLLLRAIALTDEEQAKNIQALLQKNCLAVLADIKDYWSTQAPPEWARARIINVLGKVPNKAVLDFLLQQFDEPAASVQSALGQALSLHQPESINPLLVAILAPKTTGNATRAAVNALKQIGAGSVSAICLELLHIQSHADAPELGLRSLVELLNYFRENALLPGSTNEVVRALIVLLSWLVDNTRYMQLAAYVIQVMVGLRNPLAVPRLIKLLARSEAALNEVCTQAIVGLSTLGDSDIAFSHLINALDSTQETLTTARVCKTLLEMKPFPYDRLLAAFKDPRDAVVQQVRRVFIANQHISQTAPFLVSHLLDDDDGDDISYNIEQTIKAMQPRVTMPHLVKALNRAGWQVVLEPLLLGCPEPAIVIPLLVDELGDAQRRGPAGEVLLKFNHPLVVPWLISGLENSSARQSTKWLIAQMVDLSRQHNIDLLPHVVGLFNPAAVQPQRSDIPSEPRIALRELLTHELASVSLPALINGLEKQPLIEDCMLSLVALVNVSGRQDDVLQAVLQALHNPYKRPGAHNTLVRCGQLAAEAVCSLLQDGDSAIVDEARSILAEMGELAFPLIHKLAHDPQRISDAKRIFMLMPSSTAAKGILSFLASSDIQEMEMAFYLLYMSIDNEYRSGRIDITGAMLQQAQKQPSDDVRLRVITALLFFNNNTQTQQRKKIAEHIIEAIKSSPEYHAEFMRALLLLGKQAEEPLANVIDATKVSSRVQLEAIGTLGTLIDHPTVTRYVKDLTAAGGKRTRDLRLQEQGFRALGGLLASGIYNREELTQFQNNSKRNGDLASFEFYDVLLGTRNMPEIKRLKEQVRQLQSRADAAEQRAGDAESRADRATRRADAAEQRASTAESRADAAEQRANTAEQHATRLQAENNTLQSRRWQ
jgi:hypothetical protein